MRGDFEDLPQDAVMKDEDDDDDCLSEFMVHHSMELVEDPFTDSDSEDEPMDDAPPSGTIVHSSDSSVFNYTQQPQLQPQFPSNLLKQRSLSISEESLGTAQARQFLFEERGRLSKEQQRLFNRKLMQLQHTLGGNRRNAIKQMCNEINHSSLYVAFGRSRSQSGRRHFVEVTSTTSAGYDLATRNAAKDVAQRAHMERSNGKLFHESSVTTVLFKPAYEFDDHILKEWKSNHCLQKDTVELPGPIYGYQVDFGPCLSSCMIRKILVHSISFLVLNGEAVHFEKKTLKLEYIKKFPRAGPLQFDLGPVKPCLKKDSSRCSSEDGEGVRNLFKIDKQIKKRTKRKRS